MDNQITTELAVKYTADPTHCPRCGSEDLETLEPKYQTPMLYEHVVCTDCGLEWIDAYKLVAVAKVEEVAMLPVCLWCDHSVETGAGSETICGDGYCHDQDCLHSHTQNCRKCKAEGN